MRRRLPLGHYLGNAETMMKCWSVDRTKHKSFKDEIMISLDDWKLAYSFIKDNGQILKITLLDNTFIVCAKKYESLIPDYQKLIFNIDLNFCFDEATNLVSHVFYVVLNINSWLNSTCTCCNYFKTYMCIHIMSVAVSNNLVKIPNYCKTMINVGAKPKRGRIPNAFKGLKKQ